MTRSPGAASTGTDFPVIMLRSTADPPDKTPSVAPGDEFLRHVPKRFAVLQAVDPTYVAGGVCANAGAAASRIPIPKSLFVIVVRFASIAES